VIDPVACVPRSAFEEYGLVKWVIDGATIVVDLHGQLFNVRYLGVDVPENTPIIRPYGPPAKARNTTLVANQVVRLVPDGHDKDAYGQLLRYVFIDNLFVNYELVKEGLARATAGPLDSACAKTFSQAEGIARQEKLGLWAESQ